MDLRVYDQSKRTSSVLHDPMSPQPVLGVQNVEAKVFGYCVGVIFHRGATNSLESFVRLGMMKSDEVECIGRKLAVVGGV